MEQILNELALFAGAGGGILGGKFLGWRTVCAVECDAYAASVLAQRQNDGLLEAFPIWSDVCSFDGRPWRGIIDVISGGFPCQDISLAGRGAGIDGERSGLWKEFARIISDVRPRFAFIENSPALTIRGLDSVLCDLAEFGYNAKWTCLSSAEVGARHLRNRIWIVANSMRPNGRLQQIRQQECENKAEFGNDGSSWSLAKDGSDSSCNRWERIAINRECKEKGIGKHEGSALTGIFGQAWGDWSAEPFVGRVADGVAYRVDRLKAIGNGQVPKCAAEAWKLLSGE